MAMVDHPFVSYTLLQTSGRDGGRESEVASKHGGRESEVASKHGGETSLLATGSMDCKCVCLHTLGNGHGVHHT